MLVQRGFVGFLLGSHMETRGADTKILRAWGSHLGRNSDVRHLDIRER